MLPIHNATFIIFSLLFQGPFKKLDENENKTFTKYDSRRVSTDTLLSIDQYDEEEVNDTRKIKSPHRRLSKRALSYTEDNIADDIKNIQSKNLGIAPPMRVESILELNEHAHTDDVFHEDSVPKETNDNTNTQLKNNANVPEAHKTEISLTNNIYVHNANENKIFNPKKSRISPTFEKYPPSMYESSSDDVPIVGQNIRSLTAFSVISKPSTTTPRVVLLEPF